MQRVNIVFGDNGRGLTRDAAVLSGILAGLGRQVTLSAKSPMRPPRQLQFAPEWWTYSVGAVRDRQRAWRHRFLRRPRWDVNVFIESVDVDYLPLARQNWFFPHQEWLTPADQAALNLVDLVLFKTRHAQQTLAGQARRSVFVGFTSADRYAAGYPREWHRAVHVAGWNPMKGTGRLLELWAGHPEWPQLTVVTQLRDLPSAPNILVESGAVSDARVRELQNTRGIHVAPSEVEGFGHTLREAMSCGGVVVTTDAPPMNEVAGSSAILVAYDATEPMSRGVRYRFSASSLAAAVGYLAQASPAELGERGAASRADFESMHAAFVRNLKELLDAV
jgi:hypothetical protein